MQTDLITKVYFNEHLTHSCVGMPQGLQALLSSLIYDDHDDDVISFTASIYKMKSNIWRIYMYKSISYNVYIFSFFNYVFSLSCHFRVSKMPPKPSCIVRHSRLPAGNALWVCQNFFFFFSFFFFFFYSSAAKVSG